jgi:glutathione S-transferase
VLTVWGAGYSVYCQVLRLALHAKGTPHDWIETDVFGDDDALRAQTARHPWGRVPAISDDGFIVYETAAILDHLEDPRFGPPILPAARDARTRAVQIGRIADAYAYRAMVWDVWVELSETPARGGEPDPATVARGLAEADRVLAAIAALAGTSRDDALAGDAPGHADYWLLPMMRYFCETAEGRAVTARHPRIAAWWAAWEERPALAAAVRS